LSYTFDGLALVTRSFLDSIGVTSYTIYAQDYGAPIAWRLALHDPNSVRSVISQIGSAYEKRVRGRILGADPGVRSGFFT